LNENGFPNISIYPNPFDKEFNIDLGKIASNAKVEIYNHLGELIYRDYNISSSLININIDAPQGVYILRIVNENGEQKELKIIKSNL
jgi:hypothetical protein